MCGSRIASATDIDFEGPGYLSGTVIGQNGWVTNSYVGPPNGTVAVSSDGPLTGAQSLLYDQAAAAVGFSASDVSTPHVITATNGNPGTDLIVSYLMSSTGNAFNGNGWGGLALSHNMFSGSSPIFLELRGDKFWTGENFALVEVPGFSYVNGDVLKVTYEIDFDVEELDISVFNQTMAVHEFTQTFDFFTPFPQEGPGGEYFVDVGLALRRGTVRFDDIVLTTVPEPTGAALGLAAGLAAIYGCRAARGMGRLEV